MVDVPGSSVSAAISEIEDKHTYPDTDSASHCSGTGYALGRLELTGADPLSTSAWTKYNVGPIFQAANGSYAVSKD
jgi:hypothetical protein